MPMLPQDLSYDDWVKFIFDHPLPPEVSDEVKQAHYEKQRQLHEQMQAGEVTYAEVADQLRPQEWYEWYWHDDAPDWDEMANPARTVEYITRAFRSIDVIAQDYSRGQMGQGLYYIISNSCSNHIFPLIDDSVPLQARVDCVLSFYDVYEKLFEVKCEPKMGHKSEGNNPLNTTCYMWWDVIPLYGMGTEKPDDWDVRQAEAYYKDSWEARQALDEPCLQVMEKTLQLKNMACLEGGLHGLGHWKYRYPQRVEQVIDDFLATRTDLSEYVRFYATQARTGQIL